MEPVTVGKEDAGGKRNGCLIGCLAAAGCLSLVGMAVIVMICLVAGSCASSMDSMVGGAMMSNDGPKDEVPEFTEVWSLGGGEADGPKVIRIKLNGVIESSAQRGGIFSEVNPYSASAALDRIHAAQADDDVDGIFLEINSPGGEVTMSDILFDALMRFRESDTNRFVFALIGDMAASGGYYVAAAANKIMAHPTSWTGSIGVIVPNYNAYELASKIGIASVPITSGENKNMLDMLQPTNAAHTAIIKRAVDQAYDRFIEVIAKGRGMKPDEIKPYADGRILTAKDALDAKLIDAIGYEEDAFSALCEMAGADDIRVYRYKEGADLGSLLRSSFLFESADGLADKIKARVDEGMVPKAEYRLR